MTEFTQGIHGAARRIYENNKGSLLRTLVYTIGHFLIAITVLMLVANVSFMIAIMKLTLATSIKTVMAIKK